MRKTMNLRSLMEGRPVQIDETISMGDNVVVGDDEDKREGVVKVANGPGDTVGVLIDGEMEMVPEDEVHTQTDESEDDDADDDEDTDMLEEGVMGMTAMPSFDLNRIRALAGIKTESFNFEKKDDEEEDDANTETDQETNADESNDDDDAEIEVAVEVPAAEVSAVETPVPTEAQPTTPVANHPAGAGEVQMMSTPVAAPDMDTGEDTDTEEEQSPLDICMAAVAQIEQSLPNISVKDYNEVRKRLEAVQSSLFEGQTGRSRKL